MSAHDYPESKRGTSSHSPDNGESNRPRRSKKRIVRNVIITVLAIALIFIGLGGGVGYFAYRQYPALNTLSNHFCQDLLQQNYSDAYQLLSVRLQSQISIGVFQEIAKVIDTSEAPVQSCNTRSQGVTIGVWPISVTVQAAIERSATYQGVIHATYDGGNWKVDAVSASLLGISLSALATMQKYCDDMELREYTSMWSLYGHALQNQDPKAQVVKLEAGLPPLNLRDTVGTCNVVSFGAHNNDSSAQVMLSMPDAAQLVIANLGIESGAWKITAIGIDQLALKLTALEPVSQQEMDKQITIIGEELAQISQGLSSSDWQGFTHNPEFAVYNVADKGPELAPGEVIDMRDGGLRMIVAGLVGTFTDPSNNLYLVLLVQTPASRGGITTQFLNSPRFIVVKWDANPETGEYGVVCSAIGILGSLGGCSQTSDAAISVLEPLAPSPNNGDGHLVAQAMNDYLIGEWVGFTVGTRTQEPTAYDLANYLSGSAQSSPVNLLSAQQVVTFVHAVMSGDTSAVSSVASIPVHGVNFQTTHFVPRA